MRLFLLVSTHVVVEVPFSEELEVTLGALKILLVGMPLFMHFHVPFFRKTFATEATLKRFFTSMAQHVCLKSLMLTVGVTADLTLKRLVSGVVDFVSLLVAFRKEPLAAPLVGTYEWPLARM